MFRPFVRMALAALAFMTFLPMASAMAQALDANDIVTIPWGDWLSNTASTLTMLAVALVGWGLRQLPAHILAIVRTAQVDQLLLKAIDYAINRTAGAAKGRELKVTVANDVLAEAIRYVLANAPGWLIAWIGGEQGVRDKIIARLDVEADAALK
jgi:hypothetical protein